jgi:CTP:phosphocholine cytidylyltransferase-like protein
MADDINAVIMAAGTSSRFAPLSYEFPKALVPVRGERLIEREIRQLHEAGIRQIVVVTGYKAGQLAYLEKAFGVTLVHNPVYDRRNNHATLWAARDYLDRSFICSADNYFTVNPFREAPDGAYYAAQFAHGQTKEWCMHEGADGYIDRITIGGRDSWYMLGHAYWDRLFTRRFLAILEKEYDLPQTRDKLWEAIYRDHLTELKMRIRPYPEGTIQEFDSLEELREFDDSYRRDTRSVILKSIAGRLGCGQQDITVLEPLKEAGGTESTGFRFICRKKRYQYRYEAGEFEEEL